jgi:hypothetical protein
LCDNCNWEFSGFAVPGTVSAKPTKNPKKKQTIKTSSNSSVNSDAAHKSQTNSGAVEISPRNAALNKNEIEGGDAIDAAGQKLNKDNHTVKSNSGI